MGNVIITGAGGFVGSALTKKLTNNGYNIIAVSQMFNSDFPNNERVVKIETEIVDLDQLLSLIPKREYEVFYHLAWQGVNGSQKADPIIQTDNIRMMMMCAKAAKVLKCKKFLCSGTVAERAVESLHQLKMTSGGMVYSVAKYCSHLMLENYCKNIDLNYIWMQFSNIYGPKNKTGNLVSYTLTQLMSGMDATFGPALQPYDFIYVDDIIEAVYRLGVCKTSKDYYFIGSGTPRVLKDYLITIGEIYGRPELIKINERQDDGIVYTMEMFDTKDLVDDIGNYITDTFEKHIEFTINNLKKQLFEERIGNDSKV